MSLNSSTSVFISGTTFPGRVPESSEEFEFLDFVLSSTSVFVSGTTFLAKVPESWDEFEFLDFFLFFLFFFFILFFLMSVFTSGTTFAGRVPESEARNAARGIGLNYEERRKETKQGPFKCFVTSY